MQYRLGYRIRRIHRTYRQFLRQIMLSVMITLIHRVYTSKKKQIYLAYANTQIYYSLFMLFLVSYYYTT